MMILVLSDEHLRETIRTMGITLTGDCQWAIKQIKAICSRMKPDYVIHAGDTFNQRNISPAELSLFKSLIEATGVAPEMHLTIQGNHDRGGDKAFHQSMGCKSIHGVTAILDNTLSVAGIDFDTDRSELTEFLKSTEADIHVCHYPCEKLNNRVESALKLSETTANLTIVGDTHTASLIEYEDRLILSPGCLFPQNKTELCSGTSVGVWAIYIDPNTAHRRITSKNIYRMPLFSRPCIDLTDIKDPTTFRRKLNELLEGCNNKLARMEDAWKPDEDIKPVVYVDAEVPGIDSDGTYILVRVSGWVEDNTPSESLEINSSIFDAIDDCMSQLTDDKDKAEKAAALIKDMLATSDSKEAGLAVLKKMGASFNETEN